MSSDAHGAHCKLPGATKRRRFERTNAKSRLDAAKQRSSTLDHTTVLPSLEHRICIVGSGPVQPRLHRHASRRQHAHARIARRYWTPGEQACAGQRCRNHRPVADAAISGTCKPSAREQWTESVIAPQRARLARSVQLHNCPSTFVRHGRPAHGELEPAKCVLSAARAQAHGVQEARPRRSRPSGRRAQGEHEERAPPS